MALKTIEVIVPAVPVAQPRARASTFSGYVQMYTPTKHPITAFKATIRQVFHAVYKGPPLTGPLECSLVFVMPRPKGMIWKRRPMPRVWHDKKPDRDNLDKAVMDALKGLAWIDDAQVCAGTIEKFIAAGDEAPHVQIRIVQLEDGNEDSDVV